MRRGPKAPARAAAAIVDYGALYGFALRGTNTIIAIVIARPLTTFYLIGGGGGGGSSSRGGGEAEAAATAAAAAKGAVSLPSIRPFEPTRWKWQRQW